MRRAPLRRAAAIHGLAAVAPLKHVRGVDPQEPQDAIHGLAAVAPLKLPLLKYVRSSPQTIHGLAAVAPLKRAPRLRAVVLLQCHPRPRGRGPIEADAPMVEATKRRNHPRPRGRGPIEAKLEVDNVR